MSASAGPSHLNRTSGEVGEVKTDLPHLGKTDTLLSRFVPSEVCADRAAKRCLCPNENRGMLHCVQFGDPLQLVAIAAITSQLGCIFPENALDFCPTLRRNLWPREGTTRRWRRREQLQLKL